MIVTQKSEILEEKLVPVPLCPPQIPHGLALDPNSIRFNTKKHGILSTQPLIPYKAFTDCKQCSMWDINWIFIQHTDISLQSIKTEQLWQALSHNMDAYLAYCLKQKVWKFNTTKLFMIRWDSSVSTVTTLGWISSRGKRFFSSLKCPADCGQLVSYSLDARDSFISGKMAGVSSWHLTIM